MEYETKIIIHCHASSKEDAEAEAKALLNKLFDTIEVANLENGNGYTEVNVYGSPKNN